MSVRQYLWCGVVKFLQLVNGFIEGKGLRGPVNKGVGFL